MCNFLINLITECSENRIKNEIGKITNKIFFKFFILFSIKNTGKFVQVCLTFSNNRFNAEVAIPEFLK